MRKICETIEYFKELLLRVEEENHIFISNSSTTENIIEHLDFTLRWITSFSDAISSIQSYEFEIFKERIIRAYKRVNDSKKNSLQIRSKDYESILNELITAMQGIQGLDLERKLHDPNYREKLKISVDLPHRKSKIAPQRSTSKENLISISRKSIHEDWEGENKKRESQNKTGKTAMDLAPDSLSVPQEVLVSYAWGGESEKISQQISQAIRSQGVTVVHDKRDARYKANIKEFMERIGRGKAVVIVISDKYLKSQNCMFELLEISANGDFYNRIFPVVLSDAQIYRPVPRISYVKHWDKEIKELTEALKEVDSPANLASIHEELELYYKIRATIAEFTKIFKNMNTLTPEMHTNSNFFDLIEAIKQRLASP